MTDEEALKFYDELLEHFNGNLPNFEHEPRQFANCVRMFKYWKQQQNDNSALSNPN